MQSLLGVSRCCADTVVAGSVSVHVISYCSVALIQSLLRVFRCCADTVVAGSVSVMPTKLAAVT